MVRSVRRTVTIEINDALEIILRTPLHFSDQQAQRIMQSYECWIEKHLQRKAEQLKNSKIVNLSQEETETLKQAALRYIPERTAYFSGIMGLQPAGVKITAAKKRFGSCSGKNSLCFSLYLMAYPKEAIDYVVVHELAHIVYKNHGKAFYALIETYLPDYQQRRKLLK